MCWNRNLFYPAVNFSVVCVFTKFPELNRLPGLQQTAALPVLQEITLTELKGVPGYGDVFTLAEALDTYLEIGFAIEDPFAFLDWTGFMSKVSWIRILAHDHINAGSKIMVYTVNDLSLMESWCNNWNNKPPALPGRLVQFDNSGNIMKPPLCEPAKAQKKGGFNERSKKLKPHKLGLQVPFGLDSEIPEEDNIW